MTEYLKEINQGISDISTWLPVDRTPWVIAGPCSAESQQQVLDTARGVARCPNVKVFRAGLWKPRTRPNTFEGVGRVGLKWLKAVQQETGLPTTTEVANAKHVELCLKNNIDILWIGARTTVNSFLVQEIADALQGTDVPILIKNPINAELGLWIGAIERLYGAGVRKLAGIHRGFSTYSETEYRNQPNWQIPIELKRLIPRLPLICDPSHIAGNRQLIERLSQMALDFGLHGLMIETHIDPDNALSDARQQITPDALLQLLERLHARSAAITNTPVQTRMAQLRACIDQVDSRLLRDLAERMKWVEEIGRLKKQHDIPVLQIDRWEDLLADHVSRGLQAGLDGGFVKAIFEIIHTQAVKQQL
ncbi:MAG: bifunctional 3-deoxy-7-phosphoheptulonate synthase/chorismate mutase type II [Sedimentisphaerales bacterium]|nr:bifunctional 3-deoxy-7-phosphoheptulonate synthase/chorismate mutase type II [Sedimentisphaerales bacterium]